MILKKQILFEGLRDILKYHSFEILDETTKGEILRDVSDLMHSNGFTFSNLSWTNITDEEQSCFVDYFEPEQTIPLRIELILTRKYAEI